MRYFLALVLIVFAFPAVATDWVEFHRNDVGFQYYIDRSSVRSSGGHRLAWFKNHYRQDSDAFYLIELDCQGRHMPHKAYVIVGRDRLEEQGGYDEYDFGKYTKMEYKRWYVIEPDTWYTAAEKSACGQ